MSALPELVQTMPTPGPRWQRLAAVLRFLWVCLLDMWAIVRGAIAVTVLCLTALDALATALLRIPPLTPRLREVRRVIADEYRAGKTGAIDAVVVDERIDDTEGLDEDPDEERRRPHGR